MRLRWAHSSSTPLQKLLQLRSFFLSDLHPERHLGHLLFQAGGLIACGSALRRSLVSFVLSCSPLWRNRVSRSCATDHFRGLCRGDTDRLYGRCYRPPCCYPGPIDLVVGSAAARLRYLWTPYQKNRKSLTRPRAGRSSPGVAPTSK